MRFCQIHRALESAEEGICEVGARILLVPGPYPKPDYPDACQLVDALVIEKAEAAKRMHPVLRIWNFNLNNYAVQKCADELVDALSDQVGEPG